MGGSVSSGKTNDELVDNLVESGLIKSQQVERVFRAVDRAIYYLPEFKESAYKDLAWREGRLHLSAPCIYARVMEALELDVNHSFLNIGSGTGYFSTMAGLILGLNGVNHNIEIYADLVDYAKQKLVEFVRSSPQFDHFDFCVPRFISGNILDLSLENDMLLYDRIYVGVGISNENAHLIKSLMKVNGILVMPLEESLVKIRRIDKDNWETTNIMTVSFASLIQNIQDQQPKKFNLPRVSPNTLQEICRYRIRSHIRQVIEHDSPDYYKIKRIKSTFNKELKLLNNEDETSSDEASTIATHEEHGRDRDQSRSNVFSSLERLFGPGPRYTVISTTRNSNIHQQLRLMIYGRLLESDSFATTLNEPQETSKDDDSNDDNENDQAAPEVSDGSDLDEASVEPRAAREAESTTPIEEQQWSIGRSVETREPLEPLVSLLRPSNTIAIPAIAYVKEPEASQSVCESGFSENSIDHSPTSSFKDLEVIKRKRFDSSGVFGDESLVEHDHEDEDARKDQVVVKKDSNENEEDDDDDDDNEDKDDNEKESGDKDEDVKCETRSRDVHKHHQHRRSRAFEEGSSSLSSSLTSSSSSNASASSSSASSVESSSTNSNNQLNDDKSSDKEIVKAQEYDNQMFIKLNQLYLSSCMKKFLLYNRNC